MDKKQTRDGQEIDKTNRRLRQEIDQTQATH